MSQVLKQKITLIGSSGLIGKHFLNQINKNDFQNVKAITRRKIENLENMNFITQSIHDFTDLKKMRNDLKTDVLVSALGLSLIHI